MATPERVAIRTAAAAEQQAEKLAALEASLADLHKKVDTLLKEIRRGTT